MTTKHVGLSKISFKGRWLAIGLALALLSCGQSRAATILWDDSGGGPFSDTDNWDPMQIPLSGDEAIFDLNSGPSGYTVTFDGNKTNTRLILNTDVVTFNLGGSTYTLNAESPEAGVIIGDVATDVADLTLTNGTLASDGRTPGPLIIGNASGSSGSVTVNGAGSMWTSGSDLRVGNYGGGTMNITGAGTVSNSNGYIGNRAGSTGTVTVEDAGSTWTNRNKLYVGDYGTGTMNVNNGGAVSNDKSGYIGNQAGSTGVVTVAGNGSTWTNLNLYVGNYGNGTLNITGGGLVVNTHEDSTFLGAELGSNGTAIVTGADSTGADSKWYIEDSDLIVGDKGKGVLHIKDSGVVDVWNTTLVRGNASGQGTIHFDNGHLVTGSLSASPNDLLGTGNIETFGLISDLDLILADVGDFQQTISLNGPGQNITIDFKTYLDINDNKDKFVNLGAGHSGVGTLTISDGVSVVSEEGKLGVLSGSNGTATVSGADSTWVTKPVLFTGDTDFFVGYGGAGTLLVEQGGKVESAIVHLGESPTATGMATVTGANSSWKVDEELVVGSSGTGTLRIENSGHVDVTKTTWIRKKASAKGGTVHINTGGEFHTGGLVASFEDLHGDGTIHTNGIVSDINLVFDADGDRQQTILLNGPGQNITIDIDMPAERNDNDSKYVGSHLGAGHDGSGTLTITGGVTVASKKGTLGALSGSVGTAIVSGTDSTWSNSDLFVGYGGAGTLLVAQGGKVESTSARLGESSTAIGTAIVAGAGSSWNVSGDTAERTLQVGFQGEGTLLIQSGGQVNSQNVGIGSSQRSGKGDVAITGQASKLTVSSNLDLGYSQGSPATDTLTLNGGIIEAGQLTIYRTGELILNGGTVTAYNSMKLESGRLRGTGNIVGRVENRGLIAPGFSPGIITIDGDYSQIPSGKLEIEVGGLTPGTEHDQLDISGSASLAGRLEVPLIDPAGGGAIFEPTPGESITILTADNGVSGQFHAVVSPNLEDVASNIAIDVTYNSASPGSVVLDFVPVDAGNQFISTAASSEWIAGTNWSSAAPDADNATRVDRQDQISGDQRVTVSTTTGNVQIHSLILEGDASDEMMTVNVTNGLTLATTTDITVGAFSELELGTTGGPTGNVAADTIAVNAEATVRGNGTLGGNVTLGSGATLSPGFSIGHVDVEGNYQQEEGGRMLIEIESLQGDGFQNDEVNITGTATLGGTLKVDVSQLDTIAVGTTITILTADGGIAPGTEFDQYDVQGFDPATDDVWLTPVYSENQVALSGDEVCDIVGSNGCDSEDIEAFAIALIDWQEFDDIYGYNPAGRLDFSGSQSMDFDDIEGFRNAHPGASGAAVAAAIEALLAQRAVPEPASWMIVLVGLTMGITYRSRFPR